MTFGEALDQWHKGRVVARREWPSFARNIGLALSEEGGKCLRWCGPKGWHSWGPYTPHSEDLFALDWENVEAARPESR